MIKNDVIKKTKYGKLVAKINGIDNTNFVSRIKYEKDGSDFQDKIDKIDKKILDVTNLVKKTDFNTKVTELEGKIPDVSSLATKSALTVVENKIPDVSNLVKKTDFNTKVTEIEGKIPSITGLATNSELSAVENKIPDVSSLVKKTNLNAELKKNSDRITSNKSRHLQIENELKKLQKFDAAYFRGKNYFDGNDGAQNYLVFQGVYKYFEDVDASITIIKFHANSWISKGLSDEKISLIVGLNVHL